jgi:phenylalanyl-tRNA synthetase beta chain
VKRLAGIEVPVREIVAILRGLGFAGVSDGPNHTILAVVPSWRPDIEGKADLVEEVIRIKGLDAIPAVPLPRAPSVSKPVLTLGQTRTRRAKRALANRGLVEAVTWSFVSPSQAETCGGGASELTLANPISADLAVMRPSLLPGLIAAAQRNAARGYADLGMFEVGQVYRGVKPDDQLTAATGIRSGTARVAGTGRHWSGKAGAVSAEDAKADALALLDALGIQPERLQITAGGPPWFHPGRSGTIELKPKTVVGWFGEIHPKVRDSLGFDGPLCGFELILETLPAPKAKPTKTKPALDLSSFQPVRRDFAFVVDRGIEAAKIIRAAEKGDPKLITQVNVFDVFEGEAIGAGRKSVAIEVTIQPREKTLTDAEIEAIAGKVVAEVTKATGASLRS